MNFNRIFHSILPLLLIPVLFSSCGEKGFKVDGEIVGADNASLLLEKSDFSGVWVTVDSTRTNGSGRFSIKAPAPASPEIYRLSLGDKFIYFPIDSIEHLTIHAKADAFGSDFSVEGTKQAADLAAFEKSLQKLNISDPEKVYQFKKDTYNNYLKDSQGGIIGYYVLTKFVGGKPFYDPSAPEDAKYYAAIATSFEQFRPNDPHAAMLKQVSLEAMKQRNSAAGMQRVVHAQEIKLLDIDLADTENRNVKLSDLAGKGKPTVVILGLMNAKESPAFNLALANLYQSLGGAVNFYQVSFDDDRYAWREAARNLPWTNVLDPGGMTSNVLASYNVAALPAVFIYNAAGELADRASGIDDLKKKLAKL